MKRPLGLAVVPLLAAASQEPKPRPNDDKQLFAGVKAPPGFSVSVFAAPTDVGYPTCVATVLPLNNVAKRGKLETSIMPVGLVEPLTSAELASILAYREPLKK